MSLLVISHPLILPPFFSLQSSHQKRAVPRLKHIAPAKSGSFPACLPARILNFSNPNHPQRRRNQQSSSETSRGPQKPSKSLKPPPILPPASQSHGSCFPAAIYSAYHSSLVSLTSDALQISSTLFLLVLPTIV